MCIFWYVCAVCMCIYDDGLVELQQQHSIYIRTVGLQLLFSFGAFDSVGIKGCDDSPRVSQKKTKDDGLIIAIQWIE